MYSIAILTDSAISPLFIHHPFWLYIAIISFNDFLLQTHRVKINCFSFALIEVRGENNF